MHQETVEEKRRTGRQRNVDLSVEFDIFALGERLFLPEDDSSPILLAPIVTARDDLEAAVICSGLGQGNAHGNQGRRIDGPIRRILVKRVGGTLKRRLEHQGTSKQQ